MEGFPATLPNISHEYRLNFEAASINAVYEGKYFASFSKAECRGCLTTWPHTRRLAHCFSFTFSLRPHAELSGQHFAPCPSKNAKERSPRRCSLGKSIAGCFASLVEKKKKKGGQLLQRCACLCVFKCATELLDTYRSGNTHGLHSLTHTQRHTLRTFFYTCQIAEIQTGMKGW